MKPPICNSCSRIHDAGERDILFIVVVLLSNLESGSLWISKRVHLPWIEDLLCTRHCPRWLAYILIILVIYPSFHFIDEEANIRSHVSLASVFFFFTKKKKITLLNSSMFPFFAVKIFVTVTVNPFFFLILLYLVELPQVKNSRRKKYSILSRDILKEDKVSPIAN